MRYLNNHIQIKSISIGARSSPLSRAQVQEIQALLTPLFPEIHFDIHYFVTAGDIDLHTSLRTLERTNFFTKEIDEALLSDRIQVGIHSAKDLPVPLNEGLELVCLTRGLDPSDVLVMKEGYTLQTLPAHSLIATSSARREANLKNIRTDFRFCDLRGTIAQRLQTLEQGDVEGVIVAEAALMRLGLKHLNREKIPGPTADGQGQLAIIARKGDEQMRQLFRVFDIR